MKIRKQSEDKQFKIKEVNAVDAPVKDINWQGEELEVHSDPLKDGGYGRPIILRKFDFELPNSKELPNKKQLLDYHKNKLISFLWKDELELIQEMKIIMGKRKFTIFATCQAKKGSKIIEDPKLLQQITKTSDTTTN